MRLDKRGIKNQVTVLALWIVCTVSDVALAQTGERISFQAHTGPALYLDATGILLNVGQVRTRVTAAGATFFVRPGLAGRCESFESADPDRAGYFIRHQDFRLKLSAFDDSSLFKNDATFCRKFDAFGERGFSFESVNYPRRYIVVKGYEVWLDSPDGNSNFADAATFSTSRPLLNIR